MSKRIVQTHGFVASMSVESHSYISPGGAQRTSFVSLADKRLSLDEVRALIKALSEAAVTAALVPSLEAGPVMPAEVKP